jgi:hypothetical protein
MSYLALAKEITSKNGRERYKQEQVSEAEQFLTDVGSTAATRKKYLKNMEEDFSCPF